MTEEASSVPRQVGSTKLVQVKIVYWGPAEAGKTTSLLAAHEDDSMGLRIAIKDFYHDATMLAAWMLASDANGKIYGLLQKYENPNARDALLETVATYFGINARDVVQGLSGEITPLPPSDDGIEEPVAIPKDVLPPTPVKKESKQYTLSPLPTYTRPPVTAEEEIIELPVL